MYFIKSCVTFTSSYNYTIGGRWKILWDHYISRWIIKVNNLKVFCCLAHVGEQNIISYNDYNIVEVVYWKDPVPH